MTPEKIPLIYEYCNRWCERCALTSRCAVFEEQSKEEELAQAVPDAEAAFFERLMTNLKKAKDLLREAALEQGIDLDALAKESDDNAARSRKWRDASHEHPLGKLSFEYLQSARIWLQTQPGMADRLEALKQKLSLGEEYESGAKTELESIRDALSIIEYYQSFIHVKVIRALMTRAGVEEGDFSDTTHADGSMKVALLAMDESLKAWENLFQLLPDQEDEFLSVMRILDSMKRIAMEQFPSALAFRRPGFDD